MRNKTIEVFINGILDEKYSFKKDIWKDIAIDYNIDSSYWIDLWCGEEVEANGVIIHAKVIYQ